MVHLRSLWEEEIPEELWEEDVAYTGRHLPVLDVLYTTQCRALHQSALVFCNDIESNVSVLSQSNLIHCNISKGDLIVTTVLLLLTLFVEEEFSQSEIQTRGMHLLLFGYIS